MRGTRFSQRTTLGIRRQLWFLSPKHREKQSVPIAVVSHAAPDPSRNPDQIARPELAFDLAMPVRPDAGQFPFKNKKEFFNIGVQMKRTFVAGRKDHRAQSEMT